MLKILRKKGVVKKVIWVIIIFIIFAFGFGGTAYLLKDSSKTSYAGKIFGEKISFDTFESAYRKVVIQSMIRYGDDFNKIKPMLNLESEAWDLLILLHEAKKQKIKVSDDETKHSIMQYPFFIRENKFDPKLYNDILRFIFRIKPREFEENARDSLKVQKLFNKQTLSLVLTEEDVYKTYKKQNEKVQISYVFVSPENFKDKTTYNEEQAKQYYLENKNDFLMPPSLNVSYISFDFPTNPESEENLETQKDAVRETAFEIFGNIDPSSNINQIALGNKLDIKETGFLSTDKPNLSLGWSYETLNKIFSLGNNEIYGPFENNKGIYIAEIAERKEAYIPSYEDVKEKSKEKVLIEESRKIAKDKTLSYIESIKEEFNKTKLKNFNKTAKELGLEIHQTPVFSRGEYLPTIGISKAFQNQAFDLDELSKLSGVVEVKKGFCILYLDSYLPIDTKKYSREKDAFYKEVLNEESGKIFNNFLTYLRLQAKLEDNISKLKEQAKDK
ncbi:MAG: peptidylprolyl isomerase [Candidatus Zapsychrus exili]|nr:peptidylprolyl isomerase [Candidatus Zapsychrus exili]